MSKVPQQEMKLQRVHMRTARKMWIWDLGRQYAPQVRSWFIFTHSTVDFAVVHIDPRILMLGDSPFRLLKNPHLWKTLPIPSMGPKYSTGQVSISLQRIGRGVVGDGEVSQDEGCRLSKWGLGL